MRRSSEQTPRMKGLCHLFISWIHTWLCCRQTDHTFMISTTASISHHVVVVTVRQWTRGLGAIKEYTADGWSEANVHAPWKRGQGYARLGTDGTGKLGAGTGAHIPHTRNRRRMSDAVSLYQKAGYWDRNYGQCMLVWITVSVLKKKYRWKIG